MRSHVEAIRTCTLVLSSGFVLELERTFYILSFSRNLISVLRLVHFGYSFKLLEISFGLFYKSDLVGNGKLLYGLFSIKLQNDTTYNTTYVQTGIKQCTMNENFSILWH